MTFTDNKLNLYSIINSLYFFRKKSVDDIFRETQEFIENTINQGISSANLNVCHSNLSSTRVSSSPTNSPKSSPKLARKSELHQSNNTNLNTSLQVNQEGSTEDNISKSSDSSLQTFGELIKTLPTDGTDKPRNISKLSERAKKKSWYSVLYPSYKSRSGDFKKLFKDVTDDERLVVDYSCALQRDILVHGRLYVSQNYLCFYANIFRWETCLSLRWKEVTAITKEKTARVIPNAISVSTVSEKHFFTSFTTRDKAFLMLFRVWQNALMDTPMQPQELWQWVHNCYGDQLGLTSEDEDYIDPYASLDEDSNIKKNKITDSLFEDQSGSDIPLELLLEKVTDFIPTKIMEHNIKTDEIKLTEGKRKISKNNRQRDEILNKNSEMLPTDMSDSSDSDQNKNIPFVSTVECTSMHEGRQLVHTILPIHIDTLFNMLFSKSKFLVDFHTARKSTDMYHGEWICNEEGIKTRMVNVTVALTPAVGPKSSNVTETQIMRECSKPGELYSIDINSVNAGIPYADSFGVLLHYCLVKTVDDHTMLSVHAQIKYKKSIWGVVKGFIEKNTWAGLEDFYNALLRALQSEYCIPPAKAKGRRPRRGITNIPRVVEETVSAAIIPEPVKPNVPVPISISTKSTVKYKWISTFVILLLFALFIVNIILLLKLHKLEEIERENHGFPSFDTLKNLPNNHKDWIDLLRKQETLHKLEMKKWQTILLTAIELLKKVSGVCQNITNSNHINNNVEDLQNEL